MPMAQIRLSIASLVGKVSGTRVATSACCAASGADVAAPSNATNAETTRAVSREGSRRMGELEMEGAGTS